MHEPVNQGKVMHKLSNTAPENKDIPGFQVYPSKAFLITPSTTF